MMMVIVSSGGVWQPIARNVWVALHWATSAPLSYDDYQDDDNNGGHDGDGDEDGEVVMIQGMMTKTIHLITRWFITFTEPDMTLNRIFHGQLIFDIQQYIGYKKGRP